MRSTLKKYWNAIWSSYWFLPALLALGALGLAFFMLWLDSRLDPDWLEGTAFLSANKPDGARALLSTIAGTMITVAGVTFSITIAAVASATSQFGPRLLSNFMQDRGNQVTLGTFIATFIFCLLVLRVIRAAPEDGVAFVPHLSVLVGIGLALASICVLIYFLHHAPGSIYSYNVTARIGRDLISRLDTLFPETFGAGTPGTEAYDPKSDVPDAFFDEAIPIRSGGDGYLEVLDEEGLLKAATSHDLLLRIAYRPGDFIQQGQAIAYAWPGARVTEEAAKAIQSTFAWGRQRTPIQDLLFLSNELVEIAARALSPGVNDPFTAINCMDWLSSALVRYARCDAPEAFRYDAEGQLRLIARPVTFEEFASATFDQLRPYVKTDLNATLHMMKVLGEVAMATERSHYRAVLHAHAEALYEGSVQLLNQERDRAAVDGRYRIVLGLLSRPGERHNLADEAPWLAGSA